LKGATAQKRKCGQFMTSKPNTKHTAPQNHQKKHLHYVKNPSNDRITPPKSAKITYKPPKNELAVTAASAIPPRPFFFFFFFFFPDITKKKKKKKRQKLFPASKNTKKNHLHYIKQPSNDRKTPSKCPKTRTRTDGGLCLTAAV
jgi:ATP-dependent Zn protease